MNRTTMLLACFALAGATATHAQTPPSQPPPQAAPPPAYAPPAVPPPAPLALATRPSQKTLTLSGGYVFAEVEDSGTDADGWRMNLRIETGPAGGAITHGFSIGYVDTSATYTSAAQTVDYSIWTIPFYYAPKMTLGRGNLKAFLKGALGGQYSQFSRTGTAAKVESSDWGFYAGASAGVALHLKERFVVEAEYEFAYNSNSYYRDGFLNSAMLGLGVKM